MNYTREDLKVLFARGAPVQGVPTAVNEPRIIGRGFFECDLIEMGFEKRELKKLAMQGILLKVTTRFKSAWRNTYVLPEETK